MSGLVNGLQNRLRRFESYTLMGIGGLNPSPSAKRKKGNRRNGFLLLLLSIRIFLNKPFGN